MIQYTLSTIYGYGISSLLINSSIYNNNKLHHNLLAIHFCRFRARLLFTFQWLLPFFYFKLTYICLTTCCGPGSVFKESQVRMCFTQEMSNENTVAKDVEFSFDLLAIGLTTCEMILLQSLLPMGLPGSLNCNLFWWSEHPTGAIFFALCGNAVLIMLQLSHFKSFEQFVHFLNAQQVCYPTRR